MTTGGSNPPRFRVRRLTAEEVSLWVEVTRSVIRKPGANLPSHPQLKAEAPVRAPEAGALEARAAHARPPEPKKTVLPLAPIERRLKQRLSRGRMDIDAAVDLHGLRQDEAHAELRRFLARSYRSHARIVLVVTGKGRSPALEDGGWIERGILRRNVPLWLAAPELRHIVLGFEEASAKHGGAGAIYVRLRSAGQPVQEGRNR